MTLQGIYPVILACNGKPRIHLDSDTDAWLRRLVVLSLKTPTHEQHFGKMAELILKTESCWHPELAAGRSCETSQRQTPTDPNARAESQSRHPIAGVRFTCCLCPMRAW